MGKIRIDNEYLNNTKPSGSGNKLRFERGELDTTPFLGKQQGFEYVGEDTRNRDYLPDDFYYKSPEKTQDYRASAQSGLKRVAQIPFKAATTFAAEVAKTPIILGGVLAGAGAELKDLLSGEDNNNFFEIAFNNKIIQSIDTIKDDVNNSSLLASYMDTQTQEGDFFDKIGSTAFWATEGADAVGFMAAMLVPGLAVSKLGAGAKMFGSLSKLKGIDKADDFAKILKSKGITAKNLDKVSITSANTVYEAGIETGGYLDGAKKELDRRLNLPSNDPDKITEKKYKELLEKAQNEGAFKVFGSNVALLTVPNSINTAWIYGNRTNKQIFKKFNKNFELKNNRIAKKTKEYSKGLKGTAEKIGGKLGTVGKVFGQNIVSEGLIEEGGQMAAEKSAMKLIEEEKAFDFSSLAESYLETLKSTDGQTAVFLGGLLGTGMYAISQKGNSKKREKIIDKMINQSNQSLDKFLSFMSPDVYQKDENGEIIFETNKETGESNPVIDVNKTNKVLESLEANEDLANAYYASIITNNKEQSDKLFDILSTQYVLPFTNNEELGPKVLEEILKNSEEVNSYSETMKKDKDKVIKDIVDKAESIKESKEDFLDLYESIFEQLEDTEYAKMDDFKNSIANDYLGLNLNKRYVTKKLEELNRLKNKSAKESESPVSGDISEEGRYLKSLITKYEKELEKINNDLSNFWSQDSFTSSFNDFKNDVIAKEEKAKEEEEAINEIIEDLDKVENINDLNQMENLLEDKYKDNPVLSKKIQTKKDELLEEEERLKREAEESNNANNNKETNYDVITNNNKEGDVITTPNNESLPEGFRGTEITISKITDSYVTIKDSKGNPYTINNTNTNKETTDGVVESDTDTITPEEISSLNKSLQNTSKENNDAKTIVTNKDGTKPDYVSQNAYEYQMNPKNKVGERHKVKVDTSVKNDNTEAKKDEIERINEERKKELDTVKRRPSTQGMSTYVSVDSKGKKTISLTEDSSKGITREKFIENINAKYDAKIKKLEKQNTSSGKLNNFEKALNLFESKTQFTEAEKEFLIDYLPLSAVIDENTELKLLPKPSYNEESQKAFEDSTRKLRKKIVENLILNKSDNLNIEVAYQKNGQIQIAPKIDGKVQENSIKDLYEFGGLLENVTEDKFFIVDEKGNLKNTKGEAYTGSINRKLAKGELYVQLTTAAGKKFPLKLNVKKINDKQAEAIYTMYSEMLTNDNGNITFGEMSNENKELLEKLIGQDIDFIADQINEYKDDLTLNQIIDFYNYQKSNNQRISTKFENGNILMFGEYIDKETFLKENIKKSFIKDMTSKKRVNVRFKNNNQNINPVFNFNNRDYLEYLLTNNIINTNAVVGKDNYTFKGDTSIYYDSNKLYINGKLKDSQPSSQKDLIESILSEFSKIKNKKGQLFTINKNNYKIFKGLGIVLKELNGKFLLIEKKEEISKFLEDLNNKILQVKKSNGPIKIFDVINTLKIKETYLLNNKTNQSIIKKENKAETSNKVSDKNSEFEEGIDEDLGIDTDFLDKLNEKKNNSKKLENNKENTRKSDKKTVSLKDKDYKDVINTIRKRYRGTALSVSIREILKSNKDNNRELLKALYLNLKDKVKDREEFEKICKIN